jgi:acetolactate synthase-1/2/3 large subunit
MKLSGAEIVLESLIREGVDLVFGYPGGANLPLYDALTRYPQVHHVLVRHEQGAAHMADGYARATGKVGVCIATSGPGATNLVTGILTAMMDSSPMVCITGQVASSFIGTDAFQEADVTGITLPITKHNYLVWDVEELADVIREAFHIARSGRPGPVLIDIPKDVQNAKTEYEYPIDEEMSLPGYHTPSAATEDELEMFRRMLSEAKRPVILAGHGVNMSGADREVLEFAERLQIPFALTLLGKGGVPETHPLCLGMMGMHGTGHANLAIQDADLLLAFGMRFDDRVTGNLKTYARNARKIHIDIDPSEIHKNVQADLPIVGDLKTVLRQLLPTVQATEHREWVSQIRDWMEDADERDILNQDVGDKLLAAHVIHDLWQATAGEAVVVTDVGQHQMWTAQYYLRERPRTLITSGGLGTMGFGLPAGIGAAMALRSPNVWVISGDGGFQMTMPELGTAMQEGVPVKICVINNGYLGMVRQWQEFFYEERYSNTPMTSPDFVKVAEAYGIPARHVMHRDEIVDAIDWAKSFTDCPVLLDFQVEKRDLVYPMVPTGADLHNMIRRPLPGPDSV